MALISERIKEQFQIRIAHEEFNSKKYEAMGNWFDLHGYKNFAKYYYKHAEEERTHKRKAVQFLLDMNELPIEPAQLQPQLEFRDVPQIIALTYQTELETTNECNELTKICLEEGNMMAVTVAYTYNSEQIEEMSNAQLLLDNLDSFGTDKVSMRLFDNWIGEELLD
jgi:ferritin